VTFSGRERKFLVSMAQTRRETMRTFGSTSFVPDTIPDPRIIHSESAEQL